MTLTSQNKTFSDSFDKFSLYSQDTSISVLKSNIQVIKETILRFILPAEIDVESLVEADNSISNYWNYLAHTDRTP